MKQFSAILFLIFFSSVAYSATFGDGRETVDAAGTAQGLTTTSQRISEITVCAETDNTGIITVGYSPVAALATREGVPLASGDCWSSYRNQDLRDIQIDSTVTNDGVTFQWILANE